MNSKKESHKSVKGYLFTKGRIEPIKIYNNRETTVKDFMKIENLQKVGDKLRKVIEMKRRKNKCKEYPILCQIVLENPTVINNKIEYFKCKPIGEYEQVWMVIEDDYEPEGKMSVFTFEKNLNNINKGCDLYYLNSKIKNAIDKGIIVNINDLFHNTSYNSGPK